jgi:hypothetical protein
MGRRPGPLRVRGPAAVSPISPRGIHRAGFGDGPARHAPSPRGDRARDVGNARALSPNRPVLQRIDGVCADDVRDLFTWLSLGIVLSIGLGIFVIVLLIQAVF